MNGYETTTGIYNNQRDYSHEKNLVSQEFNLPLSFLISYAENSDPKPHHLYKQIEKYSNTDTNYENTKFSLFLNYLANKNVLKNNQKLYSEIITFLEYAADENKLHKKRKESYEDFLKKNLFADNVDAIDDRQTNSHIELDYSKYEYNNFKKVEDNEVINKLYENGGAIYLNSEGKICCRFSENDSFKPYSKRQAEIILSSHLKMKIKIIEDFIEDEPSEDYQTATPSYRSNSSNKTLMIEQVREINAKKNR